MAAVAAVLAQSPSPSITQSPEHVVCEPHVADVAMPGGRGKVSREGGSGGKMSVSDDPRLAWHTVDESAVRLSGEGGGGGEGGVGLGGGGESA